MSPPNVAIVDYGAGNLTSVAYALRHLGHDCTITADPDVVAAASRVVFPGVGAAGAAMANLRERGLDRAIRDVLADGRPVLGICVGCQVVFERSAEDGGTPCLGLLPGTVELFRFPPGVKRKVPHMGWNVVQFERPHEVFAGIPQGSRFYFVHSYHPLPADPELVLATSVYGEVRFAAAVCRDNLIAVQFHTEKSGDVGLRLLDNFVKWDGSKTC